MRPPALIIAFIAIALSGTLASANSAGTTLFNFLYLDTNARPAAMGGAYTALATNSSALQYNPAGLAFAKRREASFMHNQHFQDITQEYFGYSSPSGWGTSFNYLSFGSVHRTTLLNPDGTGLGNAGLTDMALAFGYAKPVSKHLSMGAVLKYAKESIAGETGQGVMFDCGGMYSVPNVEDLTVAAALQNIGPNIKFMDEPEALPVVLRTGLAYKFVFYKQKTVLAVDIVKGRNEAASYRVGGEILLKDTIPLRVGITTANDVGSGISMGTGYVTNNWGFDYAFVPFTDLGNTHRFSIDFRWGE